MVGWVHCSGESDVDGESGMDLGGGVHNCWVMVGRAALSPGVLEPIRNRMNLVALQLIFLKLIAIQYLYNKYRTKGIVGGGLRKCFRRGLLICCIPFSVAV